MSGMSVNGSTGVTKSGNVAAVDVAAGGKAPAVSDATDLLPPPFSADATDDLMTTLALMTMKEKHEDRVMNDAQSRAAAKSQEEAHAHKIEKMHALADDTFSEGLMEGIADGVSAAATGISACVKFDGELEELSIAQKKETMDLVNPTALEEHSKLLIRNASLIEASGKAFNSAMKFGETSFKRDQELDRADMAQADADIDRAKGAVDSASTQSRRDQDDIRDTIGAIRSYSNAKTQLAQAALFRG